MKAIAGIALIALSLTLAACGKTDAGNSTAASPVDAVAAPAGTNWSSTVTATPDGNFVMGNPQAKVKLLEFASYTCSHCRDFAAEASDEIRKIVDTGKMSYELRNFVRDPIDISTSLLARCGGKDLFYPLSDQFFANQNAWMEKLQVYDRDAAKPQEQKAALRDIGQKTGLYALMAKRGFSPAQLNACIGNAASMKQILAMTDEAWKKVKIGGTPAFTINGALAGGSSWTDLRAALPTTAQ